MRSIAFVASFLLAASAYALTPNIPYGDVSSHLVINTRVGAMHNAVRYAPQPVLPPGIPRPLAPGHGVFAVDVGIVTGYPLDVRVLKSTGSKPIDNIVVETLRKWRFSPRSVSKAIIPVDVVLAPRSRTR